MFTCIKFVFRQKQSYSFRVANIVWLIKKKNLVNLHVVTEKSVLVDVIKILNILLLLLTEITWAILVKPL